jgi:virginiamycin B lyase
MALVCVMGVLASCGAHGSSAVKQFPLPQIGPVHGIAAGPDGRMWFTQSTSRSIGAVSIDGTIQMYQNPPEIDADPQRICAGPDGAMWFTQTSPHEPVDSGPDMIGRITVGGVWSEYPIPSWDGSPQGIAAGPDGAMWFAERHANAIGRVAMNGKIKEYVLPHDASGPTGITRGNDGKMWFTETDGNRIGSIDPASGKVSEYPIPTPETKPGPIAEVPTGDILVVIELAKHRIVSLHRGSPVHEYAAPAVAPIDVTAGPGTAVWILSADGSVGRYPVELSRESHTFWKPVSVSSRDSIPGAIASGPSKTVWFSVQKGPSYSYRGTGGIGVLDVSGSI